MVGGRVRLSARLTGGSVESGARPPSVGALARKSVAYGRSGTRGSNRRARGHLRGGAPPSAGDRHWGWGGRPPVSNAVPDAADPVAKIGDLAAAAGVRRIHVLAWRDLDDVEAGGSEVHAADVARLWAEAGLEVTMRTSYAQGQPTETVRDGYKVIRKAGRYHGLPPGGVAELARPHRPARRAGRDLERHAVPLPAVEPGPRVVVLHHVHAEMWNMVLGAQARARSAPCSSAGRAAALPPLGRSSRCPSRRSTRSSSSWASTPTGSRRPPRRRPPLLARRRAQRPSRWSSPSAGWRPVKRYDLLLRAAHHARQHGPRPAPRHRRRRLRAAHGRGGHRRARRRRLGHASRAVATTSSSTSTAGRGSSPRRRPARAGA